MKQSEEKLEYKHIALYVPYKLFLYDEKEKQKLLLEYDASAINSVTVTPQIALEHQLKPILKPVSEIGMQVVEKILNTAIHKCMVKRIPDPYELVISAWTSNGMEFFGFWHYLKLAEMHFDVFGLIDKGLAVSMSDLTSNNGQLDHP